MSTDGIDSPSWSWVARISRCRPAAQPRNMLQKPHYRRVARASHPSTLRFLEHVTRDRCYAMCFPCLAVIGGPFRFTCPRGFRQVFVCVKAMLCYAMMAGCYAVLCYAPRSCPILTRSVTRPGRASTVKTTLLCIACSVAWPGKSGFCASPHMSKNSVRALCDKSKLA